ncbi:MAG: hypothetical protein R2843_03620 [Thermomicrobiales bacterium]
MITSEAFAGSRSTRAAGASGLSADWNIIGKASSRMTRPFSSVTRTWTAWPKLD